MLHNADFTEQPQSGPLPARPRQRRGGPALALAFGALIVAGIGVFVAVRDPYAQLVAGQPLAALPASPGPALALANGEGTELRAIPIPQDQPWRAVSVDPFTPAPALATGPLAAPVDPFVQTAEVVPVAEPAAPPVVLAAPTPDPADAATAELGLQLSRRDRAAVQVRLAQAGHDPRGTDGVFGPATRAAITAWQTEWGFAPTGHLTGDALAILVARTGPLDTALPATPAKRTTRAPLTARAPSAREPAAEPQVADGACRRTATGQVVGGQSLVCDLTGFGETLLSDDAAPPQRLAQRDTVRD